MREDLYLSCKKKIENKINEILDVEINKHKDNVFIISSIEELKRLSVGGKRVRGYLIKLGQLIYGLDDESYIELAAAMEIFQTAILIHDDIIDKADKRRGMETINSKYEGHLGISKAICIGDLGYFISYGIISNLNIKSDIKDEIMKVYAKTIYNTVNGEIIDVELPVKDIDYHKDMDEKIIYDIYINKTAWYTIIGPLLIGAVSASMPLEQKDILVEVGKYLGIAFQIKDDLLGLYSDFETVGKTLNDIKEGKQTIIYKYAIEHANNEELQTLKQYYGNPNVSIDNIKEVVSLFEKLGAKSNAEKLVEEYTINAIEKINTLNIKNKELFIDFSNYLLRRNK